MFSKRDDFITSSNRAQAQCLEQCECALKVRKFDQDFRGLTLQFDNHCPNGPNECYESLYYWMYRDSLSVVTIVSAYAYFLATVFFHLSQNTWH